MLKNKEIFGIDGNRALLIRIRNPVQIARSQGGIATAAMALAPDTVEQKIYSEMAQRLGTALRNENVDAEITVVKPSDFKPEISNFWKFLAVGLGVVGAGYVGYRAVKGRKK